MVNETEKKGFGFFLLGCVIVAIGYGLWLAYKRWETVRQFRVMEQKNAQIDSVLEDIDLDQSESVDELEGAVDNGQRGEYTIDDEELELDNMKPRSSMRANAEGREII